MTSIDVVIPSYRLKEKYLLPILQMEVPEGAEVHYIIVADNPEVKSPKRLLEKVDGERVKLIINPQNLGASESRNVGIENSTADWVLFLDDDAQLLASDTIRKSIKILDNDITIGQYRI